MGGIKNKLNNKLSNKLIKGSLSLKGEKCPAAFRVGAPLAGQRCDDTVARRATEGSSNKANPLGSRLPSFSQPSEMPDGRISNTRKLNYLGLYAEKTIGSLRPITLTKYLSLACFSIAILSTLVLNILSSYSNSQILSNAEPVGNNVDSNNASTLANNNNLSTCNPTNTNAESCISLSITSSSSTSTGGNDPNLSLSIPQGGGIATGRHTVTVNSNNYTGYYVTLTGNAGSPAMTPTTSTSQAFIQSTTGTLTNPSSLDKGQWGSWGIALPNSSLYTGFNTNEADYNSTNQDTLAKTTWAAVPGKEADDGSRTIIKTTTQSRKTDAYPVYYGVRVDSPVSVPADTYTAEVVYTATTNEVPVPTIDTLSKNSYELGSGASSQITVSGTNLESTYEVYLTNTNGDRIGECTNLNVIDDSNISCTIPTSDITAGSYTIHVVTQGGEDETSFTYTKSSSQSVYDQQANIRVDFDKGMIPVKYNESTEEWEVVTDREIDSNLDNWFDYDTKKWANAVTVTKDSQDNYYKARAGSDAHYEVNDGDILGYWVYIPRYAYKVMRRESTDRYVDEQNFEIKFETTANPTKTPVESCNADARSAAAVWKDGNRDNAVESNIKVSYYQDCPGVDTNYYRDDVNKADSTAWATHPAFTWQYTGAINGFDKTIELNGLWVGKFEMTGSLLEPTILPNQKHLNQNLATLWSAVKSMGLADEYDQANSGVPVAYGKHNLSSSVTHMIKNSEWGAAAYLSASKYGVGAGLINMNQQEQAGVDGMGASSTSVTGCGPLQEVGTDDKGVSYSDGGKIGTGEACSMSNPERAYNGSLGVLASTTGNEYGVYDMSGGAWDYALGNVTSGLGNATTVSPYEFVVDIKPPYVDLYRTADGFDGERPAWWITGTNMSQEEWNTDVCTWDTCGGHALYETENFQINNSVFQRSWSSGKYGTDAFFPILDISINPDGTISSSPQPWIARGSAAGWSSGGTTGDSIFAYNVMAGDPNAAARVVLMPTPDF